MTFACNYKSWYAPEWKLIHFSDKTHFAVSQENHCWIIRYYNKRHEPDYIQYKSQRNAITLHYWATVGWNFKSDLDLYQDNKGAGNFTIDTYIKVLKRTYLSKLQRHKKQYLGTKGEFILKEDGDSAHKNQSQRNKVVTFKNKHEIKYYKNCPYSPDLFIIETVWRTLK